MRDNMNKFLYVLLFASALSVIFYWLCHPEYIHSEPLTFSVAVVIAVLIVSNLCKIYISYLVKTK